MHYLIWTIIFLLTLSCQRSKDSGTALSDIDFSGRLNAMPVLGTGYNSLAGKLTSNRCVIQAKPEQANRIKPELIDIPSLNELLESEEPIVRDAGSAHIVFKRDQSYEDILDALGLGIDVKVRIHPLISLKGELDYAMENAHAALDETYSLIADIRQMRREITEPILDPETYERANRRHDDASDKRRPLPTDVCGDEFVYGVEKGTSVFATLSIKYDDHSTRRFWNGSIAAVLIEFVEAGKAHFSDEQKTYAEKVRVNLSVMQRGGRPEDLLSLLQDTGDATSASGIISCNLLNLAPCTEALKAVVKYVHDLPEKGTTEEHELYPLAFKTKTYKEAVIREDARFAPLLNSASYYLSPAQVIAALSKGLPKPGNISSAALSQHKQDLLEKIDEMRGHLRTADAVMTKNTGYYGGERFAIIERAVDATQKNLKSLLDAYRICFDRPEFCAESTTQTLQNLHPTHADILYDEPRTFTEWCQDFLNGRGNGQDRVTVYAMLRYLTDEPLVPDLACGKFGDMMNRATYIKIDKRFNIMSLRPFASLPKLRSLDVSCNRVSDLVPLQDLTMLNEINLSGNDVEDLTPLQETLPNLRIVNLDRNQITGNIARLRREKPLDELYLQDNEITSFEDLSGLTNYLFVAGNPLYDVEARSPHDVFDRQDFRFRALPTTIQSQACE